MNLQGIAMRGPVLAASTYTPIVQLFFPSSLARVASGDGDVISLINWAVLCLALLGWADLVIHDIFGKLLFPRISVRIRHQFCVYFYCVLAGAFGIRAFLAAGTLETTFVVGTYYIFFAAFLLLNAYLIALEERHG